MNHSKNWAEDFFVGKSMFGSNARENCWSNERFANSALQSIGHFQLNLQTTFLRSDLDVFTNLLRSIVIDDGTNISSRKHGIADSECPRRFDKSIQKSIVCISHDDHSTARRTFLSRESKCRLAHAKNRFVQICAFIDNDRIFPAHFADHFLDAFLIRKRSTRCFNNVQSNTFRSCECDECNARIAYERCAHSFARTWQECERIFWRTRGPENFAHQLCNGRGLFGRLHDDSVSSDKRSDGHTATNGKWKIPRTDDSSDTARLKPFFVQFACEQTKSAGVEQLSNFSSVILAEIDCLADIAVSLAPCFSCFANDDSAEFVTPGAHRCCSTHQHSSAFEKWRIAPRWKSTVQSIDCRIGRLRSAIIGDVCNGCSRDCICKCFSLRTI